MSPTSRTVRWVAVAIVVAGVAGAVWTITRDDPPAQKFCKGVGLITETRGSTPDEAFGAFMVENGWDPKEWELVGSDRNDGYGDGMTAFTYEPRDPAHDPSRYLSVQVVGAGSDYRASGACVP